MLALDAAEASAMELRMEALAALRHDGDGRLREYAATAYEAAATIQEELETVRRALEGGDRALRDARRALGGGDAR